MNKTRDERRSSMIAHYAKYGGATSYQHMLDLDDEFPSVEIFGPQCISAEVGPGWIQLLRPVMEALSANRCKAGQIKQKFGGLRLYWDYPDYITQAGDEWRKAGHKGEIIDGKMIFKVPYPFEDDRNLLQSIIGPLVDVAQNMSYGVCEKCGTAINPPRNAGFKTECDRCKTIARSI